MLVHHGGQATRAGTYVGLDNGDWLRVAEDGGVLPGRGKDRYMKMPLAAIAAPVLGLAYLIFLPLVGFLMGGGLLVWKGVRALKGAGQPAVQSGENASGSQRKG